MHARLALLTCLVLAFACPAQTPNWSQPRPTTSPTARERLNMTYDTARQYTLLFGGWDGTLYLNDTWTWNGTNWTRINPTTQPGVRDRHGMAYDSGRQRTVLFGGCSRSSNLNDTWEWDGRNWIQRKPTTRPTARWNRGLVYDPIRQRTVLFGGWDGNSYLNDTWEWDGWDWKRVRPVASPPNRNGHSMAYDAGRQRTVMFGGFDGAANLSDTWEYDGKTWTQQKPTTMPSGRREHSMVYDSARQRIVLFGGFDGTTYLNDSWEWDGKTWTQLQPATQPGVRHNHAMAYDSARQRTVLFGGFDGSSRRADTWELAGARLTLTTDTSIVSIATGGTQRFFLDAGTQHARRLYWVLGSVSGTSPGINLGGVHFPLNPDPWTDITLVAANTTTLASTRGTLDASGRGRASFNLPKVPDARAIGTVFHHAFLVYDNQGNFHMVSNPVALTLVTSRLCKIEEDFANDRQLDRAGSAGSWGSNKITFARIGGDGILGEFVPAHGTRIATDVYQWSTDGGTTIPNTTTLDNMAHRITDGVFSFSDFVLPAGVTVHFVGTKPLQINVRGEIRILGKLLLNGVDLMKDAHRGSNATGEKGSVGGPGGGSGGNGGDRGDGVSNKANFNGQPGADVQLPAGHAYANTASTTGGAGSRQHPANGLQSSVRFVLFNVISAQATSGGGGGGNLLAGKIGTVLWTDSNGNPNATLNREVGPSTLGGTALGWQPVKPSNRKSLEHHRVGGSGGGGAGSHPLASINPSSSGPRISYNSSRAGAGGGGAAAIRSGQRLTMAAGSLIQARGGSASPNLSNAFADRDPAPGGGGSGGTIFLQIDGGTDMKGALDVSGGDGGLLVDTPTFGDRITIKGGDGGAGVIRMETTGTLNAGRLGTTVPVAAKNTDVQNLTDKDTLVGVRSRWYAASLVFKPDFVRYEVEAKVNGQTVIYSDDSRVGILAARGATPIFLLVQGAQVQRNQSGVVEPIPSTIKPWRTYVGPFTAGSSLSKDSATGYRFTLVLDRSFGRTVEVKKVTVYFRL